MCGRFSLFKISEFLNKYNLEQEMKEALKAKLKPRYNIAPTQEVPVIKDGNLEFLKWGLPFKTAVINTRVETWQEKPFFKNMDRILVPADGFYEWKDGQPYRMETGGVFAMAGVTYKGGFSIITTPPNTQMKKIHNRMPAVLKDEQAWLKDAVLGEVPKFNITPISKLINSPKNDTKEVLA